MSNAKNNAEQRALLKIVPYHITQPLQNQMPNSHIWWIFELKLYLDVSKGELKKKIVPKSSSARCLIKSVCFLKVRMSKGEGPKAFKRGIFFNIFYCCSCAIVLCTDNGPILSIELQGKSTIFHSKRACSSKELLWAFYNRSNCTEQLVLEIGISPSTKGNDTIYLLKERIACSCAKTKMKMSTKTNGFVSSG